MMKTTILLVEDDYASSQMLEEMLTMADYDVETADTLDKAVTAMSERRYDAALLDLTLAGASTAVLIERLRKVPERPPLVIFSARTNDDLRRAAERLSAAAVLQKPASMEALLATLARVAHRPS
ncbi:response regulator [Sorangium sp. So ce1078]|uniref:response regulator n=1 Tax=Sorangium sp. So ce1078 TaxID=3133329 RepID=UPI003F62F307